MNEEKYEKGSILKFEDVGLGTVISLGTIKKGNTLYVLVMPYNGVDENTTELDFSKVLLLKITENDDAMLELDVKNIEYAISKILKEK